MTNAIIPKQAAPLRTLTVTMAVMCYLACLAIGALILINRAVDAWTSGLAGEVTVQIRETRGADMDKLLSDVKIVLDQTPGIVSSEVLAAEVGEKLLEPWLGTTDLSELPVPRLVRAKIDTHQAPDFVALDQQLKTISKGVSVDTHQRWVGELTRMASSMSQLSWLVLLLIAISAIAMVIFATRAALAANAETVAVLHMVGASNGFIAGQIDRRFLTTGLIAGVAGTLAGVATFLLFGLSGKATANGLSSAVRELLYVPEGADWKLYVGLLLLPIVATLIAIITSRLTLMRMLGEKP
jgi:cell division transport system permease protein